MQPAAWSPAGPLSSAGLEYEGGDPAAGGAKGKVESQDKSDVPATGTKDLEDDGLTKEDQEALAKLEADHRVRVWEKRQEQAEGFANAWRKHREQEKERDA